MFLRIHALLNHQLRTLCRISVFLQDLNAMNASHRGAKANASDVMQAQLTLSQAQDATRKNTQDLKNVRLALSRWTGMPAATVAYEKPS